MSYFDGTPTQTAIVIANILSVISLVAGFIAESFRKKRTTLIIATIVKIPTLISAILLRAINSIQSAIMGPVRNLLCVYIDNKRKSVKIFVTFSMCAVYTIVYLMGYQGVRTILGLIGVIGITTSGVWCDNRGRWKVQAIISNPCYVVYNLLTYNYTGATIIALEIVHRIIMLKRTKDERADKTKPDILFSRVDEKGSGD